MNHTEWLKQVTKSASMREVSRRSGVAERTVASQIERNKFSAGNVIRIAVGFDAHPVTALVDCGYIDPEDAKAADPLAAIRKVTDDELADEVLRRLRLAGDHTALTTPIDELVEERGAAESTNDAEVGAADPEVDAAAGVAELKREDRIDGEEHA